MDAVKTILAGCGVLALLSVVGCVGLVGVGSYAVDQALDEQEARESFSRSPPSRGSGNQNGSSRFGDDPFSDYDSGGSANENKEEAGGWGEGTE